VSAWARLEGIHADPEPRDAGSSVVPDIRFIRPRSGEEQPTTFFELFFDLVYVFAITQLSHHLLEHLTWTGAAQMGFMLVAVYWAWNYTTWMANWFDPDTTPVRVVLVFVMLASLLMAVAIPEGFDDRAWLFAAAYCALQVGRNAFVVAVTPPGSFHGNFVQILWWSVLSVPLWIAGGVVDSNRARWWLWLGALGIDLAGPLMRYWLPRRGTTPLSQWQINGAHFAERFQLFVIIALGESIVLAGAAASDSEFTAKVVVALAFALVGSTALWWLYFGDIGDAVKVWISASGIDERGRIGRDVYTYLHLPIIAGIVIDAVGAELVIAHPDDDLHTAGALVALGGPALFLIGVLACSVRLGQRPRVPVIVAAVVLLAAIPLAAVIPGLLVLGLVAALLSALVAVEHR
jgi:low temperature requirement protein LtrA